MLALFVLFHCHVCCHTVCYLLFIYYYYDRTIVHNKKLRLNSTHTINKNQLIAQ